ncbi:MAG: tetratricopeptide repeat protein [Holosporales bacterium]|jgi:hypothetical protein|nr:tetratricopeptide repeat protein [Holosporales bacterium]
MELLQEFKRPPSFVLGYVRVYSLSSKDFILNTYVVEYLIASAIYSFYTMFNDKKNGPNTESGGENIDNLVVIIEEEIRSENWRKFWNRYGKLITYTIAVVLASFGVYEMWRKQDLSDREAISIEYTSVQNAIASGDSDSAFLKVKELANVSKKNYAALARFEYAAILKSKNDRQALVEYMLISDDEKVDKMLRSLAYIFYVNSAIDLLPNSELIVLLDEFISKLKENYVGKLWDLLAKESLAFCYIKQGNNKAAKLTLESLAKTTGIPPIMAERTRALLHFIGEQ